MVKRVRPLYVVAAWCFHLGTLLLLGLDYAVWPATVTILLVDWPAVTDRVQRWRTRAPTEPLASQAVG